MMRIYNQSKIDSNHQFVNCNVCENSGECIALFSCLFEGFSIKTFHVDTLRPSSINVGMEYQLFINHAFRIVREGITPDEASILDI